MGSVEAPVDWRHVQSLHIPALVVGGGFSGFYALHKLRQSGIDTKLFEAGQQLGGVWNWNRYPGARVDSEIPFYQYSIPQTYKDWTWKERFPDSAEIRQYFHHTATVQGLYDHIAFGENVNGCDFDTTQKEWIVQSSTGKIVRCKYLVVAVGSSYKKHYPAFPGLDEYQGTLVHAAAFPEKGINFDGKRAAVVGQGATGVQLVQEISKQAEHLGVYCRTPNLAIPMQQRKLTVAEQTQHKSFYPHLFRLARASPSGIPYASEGKSAKEYSAEEREAICEELWRRGGFNYIAAGFNDILFNQETSDMMYAFWRKKVQARIKDPRKREILAPQKAPHPFATKRSSQEQDYYECMDRPNVELIDLSETNLKKFNEKGIVTSDGTVREYDVIVLATGYDSITGSFTNMGLRDVHGADMKEKWKAGVRTHLGMTCPGFPNMFMLYGPQGEREPRSKPEYLIYKFADSPDKAPTALSNGVPVIEGQGDWIASTIQKMQNEGIEVLEALPEAAEKWAADIQDMNAKTLFPLANSWYMGDNIPGKKREQLNYVGGVETYERVCKEHQKNWTGFKTTPSPA